MSPIGEENKSKRKKASEFEFCKVCKLNHDQGKAHKYYPTHKSSLSAYLSRFRSKVLDVRFFLKNPSFLRPELASRNRFWCVFCDTDVDEVGSSFACANAILHLESNDHLKYLKHFFWKYGGGMENMDTFRILEADVAKWEKKCKALENDPGSVVGGSNALLAGPSNGMRIRYPIQVSQQNHMRGHFYLMLPLRCLLMQALVQVYVIQMVLQVHCQHFKISLCLRQRLEEMCILEHLLLGLKQLKEIN